MTVDRHGDGQNPGLPTVEATVSPPGYTNGSASRDRESRSYVLEASGRELSAIRKVRQYKLITVAFFFALLSFPSLQQHLNLVPYSPLAENRLRAKRPENPFNLLRWGSNYAQKYELYFNDNYGFRDLLIQLKNQIDYSLFKRSREVIIGRDHWLFYRNVVERQQMQLERASPAEFTRIEQRLLALNSLLRSRGIKLVVLCPPMKNTIYPEYLPAGAPRRPTPNAYDRYVSFLKAHPEIGFLDAREILLEIKKTRPVFHKTDFHWNDPAGFDTAKELINYLGRISGTATTWKHPLRIKVEKLSGGQNLSLGVFWPYVEDALMVELPPGEPYGIYRSGTAPNSWEYVAKDLMDSTLLPPTVIFGDSFSDAFLRSDFARYFSEVHKYYVHNLADRLATIPANTKLLILEHVEVAVTGLLVDASWPEEIR